MQTIIPEASIRSYSRKILGKKVGHRATLFNWTLMVLLGFVWDEMVKLCSTTEPGGAVGAIVIKIDRSTASPGGSDATCNGRSAAHGPALSSRFRLSVVEPVLVTRIEC